MWTGVGWKQRVEGGGQWFESKKLNERIALFSPCLFMSNVMPDMHSLYCDNLLCSEEKTVKLKYCYLMQHLRVELLSST